MLQNSEQSEQNCTVNHPCAHLQFQQLWSFLHSFFSLVVPLTLLLLICTVFFWGKIYKLCSVQIFTVGFDQGMYQWCQCAYRDGDCFRLPGKLPQVRCQSVPPLPQRQLRSDLFSTLNDFCLFYNFLKMDSCMHSLVPSFSVTII